jgi:hypothetical protein
MTIGMPTFRELFPIPTEARKLQRFLGSWRIRGTLTVEGTPLAMSGTWTFEEAAGGWGVKATMRATVDGMGSYEEDDLVGFDVETGTYHVYSLTNSSAVHDHIGVWVDERTFTIAFDALQTGKPFREEVTVNFVSDRELEIHEKDYLDGQIVTMMDAVLRK